jgi:hypothetical protein
MERVILKARDGFIYTNGETYGYIVYLAVGNDGENWYEITTIEYEEILAKEAENLPM